MHLNYEDWTRFCANSGSKSTRMAKLWQFSKGHPKSAFSEKVQRGDQAKFFKNRPKTITRLKGPEALWGKCHYFFISMHLNCKDWKRFLAQTGTPKLREWPSYSYFRKVSQNPHFLKKYKGGTKENFSKIAQKKALV